MNPAWIHASESLVPLLARGELGDSDDGKLSQVQTTLHIPPSLVYLCGMVTHFQREPPFSKDQVDWFQKLQSIYHKETGSPHRLYLLSPTLLPTEDLRNIIRCRVTRRLEEIEAQAASAQEKILAMEQEQTTIRRNKVRKATRRPHKSQLHESKPEHDDGDGCASDEENQILPDDNVPVTANSTSTLDELMKPLFVTEDRGTSTSDWTEVKPKKKVLEPCPSVTSRHPRDDGTTNEEKEILDEAQVEQKDVDSSEAEETELRPCLPNLLHLDGSVSSTQISDVHQLDRDCEASLLRNKIHELELELAAKEELLQKERVAHAKALLLEKEQSHERMQSLQLRLYISESRLKTFEDALDQHMEAVANNVAIGSPERRVRRMLQEEENEVVTPLYSRSLRK